MGTIRQIKFLTANMSIHNTLENTLSVPSSSIDPGVQIYAWLFRFCHYYSPNV